MTPRCLRATFIAGAALVSIGAAINPAHAQWIVFDPTNYSQNVLTAARALEQVNNQIQSLENEAKMLTNQAKNLVSLPYSSLTQLQQSISQTEQLLSRPSASPIASARSIRRSGKPTRRAIPARPRHYSFWPALKPAGRIR